jgi:uncharacterized protein YyaL (SSP411 family)
VVNNSIKFNKANKLINEKSPYLLDHAHNPVNWYPWSEEAFDCAKRDNKPVFLSIGYSTCHWCHVMAHESFEDEEVAKYINENLIPIKVDREEQPDVDSVYMKTCQLLNNHGGWPLTAILTPDKKPFYVTTYLPKNRRGNRIGLIDLIKKVSLNWQENQQELIDNAEEITNMLKQYENNSSSAKVTNQQTLTDDSSINTLLEDTYKAIQSKFDSNNGGFGGAPKFPLPLQLVFLVQYWKKYDFQPALEMVNKTLHAMRKGGIFDQIGFGFHQYSTDKHWKVPHFEKMLYNQALLLYVYSNSYQATQNNYYKKTSTNIITYLKRKLLAPEGGFYSAEDADTNQKEGDFYTWTKEEVYDLLSKEDADYITNIFNIKDKGNYNDEATDQKTGNNILFFSKNSEHIVNSEGYQKIIKKMLDKRKQRTSPAKDDKIITAWNGLIIVALAKSGWVFENQNYIDMAKNSVEFIVDKLSDDDNLLYHQYVKGETKFKANLDDYAFLTWGLIELYEATFEEKYISLAKEFTDKILNDFWDEKNGGFFYKNKKEKTLLIKEKKIYDGSLPSSNSVSLLNLVRLSHLTEDMGYQQRAEEMTDLFMNRVKENPFSYPLFIIGIINLREDFSKIVIASEKKDKKTNYMFNELRKHYWPNNIIKFVRVYPNKTENKYKTLNGRPTVYICKNFSCQPPLTEISDVIKNMES